MLSHHVPLRLDHLLSHTCHLFFQDHFRCFCWKLIIETKYRTCEKNWLTALPCDLNIFSRPGKRLPGLFRHWLGPSSVPLMIQKMRKKNLFPSSGWDVAWLLLNFLKIRWQLCYNSKAWFSENDWASAACLINLWYNTANIKNSTISHSLATEHTVHSHAKPDAWLMLGNTLN